MCVCVRERESVCLDHFLYSLFPLNGNLCNVLQCVVRSIGKPSTWMVLCAHLFRRLQLSSPSPYKKEVEVVVGVVGVVGVVVVVEIVEAFEAFEVVGVVAVVIYRDGSCCC